MTMVTRSASARSLLITRSVSYTHLDVYKRQSLDREALERENEENLRACQQYGHPYVLIDREYEIDLEKIL